MIVEMR